IWLLVLPGVLLILGMWIGEISEIVGSCLLALSLVTSVACLARGFTLFRTRRPLAYLCGGVGIFYLAILCIMLASGSEQVGRRPTSSLQPTAASPSVLACMADLPQAAVAER